MQVLWVSAHPDPRSLNGSLRDAGIAFLRDEGHRVVESDLYAMGWDPVVDHDDFAHDRAERLDVLSGWPATAPAARPKPTARPPDWR